MAGDSSDICVKVAKVPTDNKRINELKAFFRKEYKVDSLFVVKVPGRVNLIGEHVDYCGYPVLPMAVEQNILLAVAPSVENILLLRNVNAKYKAFESDLDNLQITLNDKGGPEWHNYFLCGIKGIFEKLPKDHEKTGMLVAVSGNIPPASGLSSSSALVSAAALGTSYLNKFCLDKQFLATVSANCERFIGTQGGGMDQAIAFLAENGSAQFIEWNPLKATPVSLPDDAVFVIANCLSEANKAANSDFNQRVVECRLGCSLIAKKRGLDWRLIDRFSTLQNALKCTLDEMESYAKEYLTKHVYTVDDVLRELDISVVELAKHLLSANTKHLQEFKIRQRSLHVFQESIRVAKFRKIAMNNGSMSELSRLMRQSHQSLKEQYECSHPNLDQIVALSDQFGVGSRLTGAGWGGCIVALCKSKEESSKYIEELKEKYYKNISNINQYDLNQIIFATSPQAGAEIYV